MYHSIKALVLLLHAAIQNFILEFIFIGNIKKRVKKNEAQRNSHY
jgi:hypothetical protein